MTFHRFVYTALPFTANNYLRKSLLKIIVAGVLLFFLSLVAVLNTELFGVFWVDVIMTWATSKSGAADIYNIINHISNYGVGIINLVAYTCLLAILIRRRLLSFTRNREIKMTLQKCPRATKSNANTESSTYICIQHESEYSDKR
ncbi:hypothetical protein ANCCAN_02672 [Ancylostoma caninum]|uniref:7TM GPCR serpentine receptor class x (Srx) domain-containing protein n=1 Tax=Ancylostoma caninum TaxID=29170 RepID=A0A368H3Y9_ANCCA|nr:hypothetical protein ANCCAN_02672 [Ancylostoma caninum]